MIFQPNLIINVVDATTTTDNDIQTTHHIGRSNYRLTTPKTSAVFVGHRHQSRHIQQPFSAPVTKLTFHQLGSSEIPNLSPYANTCKILKFNGHIHNPTTPFQILSQLPKVKKIDFFIGKAQQSAHKNDFYSDALERKHEVFPNVHFLKVVMDLEYFYNTFQLAGYDENHLTDIQHSLITLVDSLLKHAANVFPNLKSLMVDLPENERLCSSVKSFVKLVPGLRIKTRTTLKNFKSQQQLYTDGSCSEEEMAEICPSYLKHFQIHYHRSPPGFPPLSVDRSTANFSLKFLS